MKTPNIAILSVPMLVAGSIALSGCGSRSEKNPTMISYSEVGICKSYATLTGNEEKAKPDWGFVIFKIETVDNAKQSSAFNLDPERFYVDQTPPAMEQKNISFRSRRFMVADPRFAQAMGVTGLARAAFPANQKTDVNSFILVPVALSNPTGGTDVVLNNPTGESEANQTSFGLTYDTTTSEQQTGTKDVVATKTNADNTKYAVVENCKELALK